MILTELDLMAVSLTGSVMWLVICLVSLVVRRHYREYLLLPALKSNTKSRHRLESHSNDWNERQVLFSKHAILSIAASASMLPIEVLTTPPMIEPPASSRKDFEYRKQVNTLIAKIYENQRSGYEISEEDASLINREGETARPSTYGEVTVTGVRQLLQGLRVLHHDDSAETEPSSFIHFVDMGAGVGKFAVQAYLELAASHHHNVTKVTAIELSKTRSNVSKTVWEKSQTEIQRLRRELPGASAFDVPQMNVMCGDLLQMNLTDVTHLYVSSLCFSDELLNKLGEKLISEGGSLVALASLKRFDVRQEDRLGGRPKKLLVEMSWTKPYGSVVYIYEPGKVKGENLPPPLQAKYFDDDYY